MMNEEDIQRIVSLLKDNPILEHAEEYLNNVLTSKDQWDDEKHEWRAKLIISVADILIKNTNSVVLGKTFEGFLKTLDVNMEKVSKEGKNKTISNI